MSLISLRLGSITGISLLGALTVTSVALGMRVAKTEVIERGESEGFKSPARYGGGFDDKMFALDITKPDSIFEIHQC